MLKANQPILNLPETGFIRLPTILKFVPVGKSTWWRGIAEGRYPKGYKLSKNTTAWKVEDIRALIIKLSEQSAA